MFCTHKQTLVATEYKQKYDDWLLYLWAGYSIVVTGVGSKRRLLRSFIQTKLLNKRGSAVMEVDGFNPSVRHTAIINDILQNFSILPAEERYSSFTAKVDRIVRHFSDPKQRSPKRLFIVVHNLDGEHFRSSAVQTLMSELAAAPNIHLVASVDHVRNKLLWNPQMLQRFNFLWFVVPTFASHHKEICTALMATTSNTGSRRTVVGVLNVLQSVTANHRSLWRIVARRQLDLQSGDVGTDEAMDISRGQTNIGDGIEFQELVEESRRGVRVRNFRILTQQIKELEDHRLLDQRFTGDGVYVCWSIAVAVLKPIISLVKRYIYD